jgi:hypothetical protein
MFRRELLAIGCVATAIFLTVAGASWMVGRTVQQEAELIAQDTLPALANSAAAMAKMQENWLTVNRFDDVRTDAERKALSEIIHTNSNAELWQRYGRIVENSDQESEFLLMSSARSNYLTMRESFIAMCNTGNVREAISFRETTLTPAYAAYDKATKRLFDHDATEGSERALRVLKASRYTPIVLGLFCVTVFGLGVLLGLRGAFVGMDVAEFFRKIKS